MAFTNYETNEIHCKALYFGPRGSGKSTNFTAIYQSQENELAHAHSFSKHNNQFFEFLPLVLGKIDKYTVKLHLYTMPKLQVYESVTTTLLKGLDGFVFVFDSRLSAMHENVLAWQKVRELLASENYNMLTMPRVLQYNKRDHKDAVSLQILRTELNRTGQVDVEANASQGVGTMETVQLLADQILTELSHKPLKT